MEYQHCINPQKTATANIQPHHKNKYSKLLQIYSYFINIQNNTSFFVFFIKKTKNYKKHSVQNTRDFKEQQFLFPQLIFMQFYTFLIWILMKNNIPLYPQKGRNTILSEIQTNQ